VTLKTCTSCLLSESFLKVLELTSVTVGIISKIGKKLIWFAKGKKYIIEHVTDKREEKNHA
jgi:hypothetical protein